jgi:nicotinamidase-related amidase
MSAPNQFPGIGGRSGFGERPAIIVIDLTYAFTDPASQLGCNLDLVIGEVNRLLAAARATDGIPVLFTSVAYGARERVSARALLRKFPSALIVEPGSRWTEIDARLARRDYEPVITKVFPSAFFGTTLGTYLTAAGCDTVIVTGASTSGCVRATAIDAVSHGFQVIVPREAVGDRSQGAHESNLLDIDLKYGDVVSNDEVIAYLGNCHGFARDPAKRLLRS